MTYRIRDEIIDGKYYTLIPSIMDNYIFLKDNETGKTVARFYKYNEAKEIFAYLEYGREKWIAE